MKTLKEDFSGYTDKQKDLNKPNTKFQKALNAFDKEAEEEKNFDWTYSFGDSEEGKKLETEYWTKIEAATTDIELEQIEIEYDAKIMEMEARV